MNSPYNRLYYARNDIYLHQYNNYHHHHLLISLNFGFQKKERMKIISKLTSLNRNLISWRLSTKESFFNSENVIRIMKDMFFSFLFIHLKIMITREFWVLTTNYVLNTILLCEGFFLHNVSGHKSFEIWFWYCKSIHICDWKRNPFVKWVNISNMFNALPCNNQLRAFCTSFVLMFDYKLNPDDFPLNSVFFYIEFWLHKSKSSCCWS